MKTIGVCFCMLFLMGCAGCGNFYYWAKFPVKISAAGMGEHEADLREAVAMINAAVGEQAYEITDHGHKLELRLVESLGTATMGTCTLWTYMVDPERISRALIKVRKGVVKKCWVNVLLHELSHCLGYMEHTRTGWLTENISCNPDLRPDREWLEWFMNTYQAHDGG